MVIYCCVKGCKSNGNNKKKDPSSLLSFHAFPRNVEQKKKWAKAIGRPNWVPPSHIRICSMHFDHEQINYEACRMKIKDDAVPTKNLPLISNFEATGVKACRICLATDIKLYSLQDTHLGHCMDSITRLNTKCNIEGLPQYVCYQCAPCIIKFYKFLEKGMTVQATLLDIFAKNGEITTDLILQQNRDKLNLTSSLTCCKVEYHYQFKEFEDNSEISDTNNLNELDVKNVNEVDILNVNKHESEFKCEFQAVVEEEKVKDELLSENEINVIEEKNFKDELLSENEFNDDRAESSIDPLSDNEINKKDEEAVKCDNVKEKQSKSKCKSSNKLVKKKDSNLTSNAVDMQKYFDIVELSLEEQIDEWKKAAIKIPMVAEKIYECEVCYKLFAQHNSYHVHLGSHDPSRGKFECPVCKLRFKSVGRLNSHRNRAHAKKFYCKTCPKSYCNVGTAKQHHLWHSGYKYKCKWCTYTNKNSSELDVHVRRQHAPALALTCALCGRACVDARALSIHTTTAHATRNDKDLLKATASETFRCEQCDINFASEGARRVHLLTSKHHGKTADTRMLEQLKTACIKCGAECSSRSELVAHARAHHSRHKARAYPSHCSICGETMMSRLEYSQHLRRKHPKETDIYRPVVTCICDTCGQGFENTSKLQLHQLRHRAPTVRCGDCPRLFYDKYALASHATTHISGKPYQCRTCGRAFKHQTNLCRHRSVHSDLTPYECNICGKKFKYSASVNLHIRSVHLKLPLPPRKRKSKATKRATDSSCS